MALIQCPECGKEVSDKALACPNCGNPIAAPVEKVKAKKRRPRKKLSRTARIILVVCLAAVVVLAGLQIPRLVTMVKLRVGWYTVADSRAFYRLDFGWNGTLSCIYDHSALGETVVGTHPFKILSPTQLQIDNATYDIEITEGALHMNPEFFTETIWFKKRDSN